MKRMGRSCPPTSRIRVDPTRVALDRGLHSLHFVTIPRRFLPGHCHAASRRCAERRFYVRPTLETMHLLLYALGRAMRGKQLALFVFSVQATHYHVVIADLSKPGQPSDLPLFFQHFNSMAARGLNHHLGRTESVWTQGSYHSLELWGETSLLEQLLYAWA